MSFISQNERLKKRAMNTLSRAAWNGVRGRKPGNIPALILACAVLLFLYLVPQPEGPLFTGNATVIDGDTLRIDEQRYRLYGIDAPESDQTCKRDGKKYFCGKEATDALTQLIDGQTVSCEQDSTDDYNRIVAICRVGNIELNKWMVENGYAVAYRQYSERYVSDEMKAKAGPKGLWAGPFQMPWDYRHGTR